MKRKPQPITRFRPGEIDPELIKRTDRYSKDHIAKRDLGRYYTLITHELEQLDFTRNEAYAITDACNGLYTGSYNDPTYRLLWAEVHDAVALNALDEKWEIDSIKLVNKLHTLSPGAAMAVLDAVERFWIIPNDENAIITCGLTKKQEPG